MGSSGWIDEMTIECRVCHLIRSIRQEISISLSLSMFFVQSTVVLVVWLCEMSKCTRLLKDWSMMCQRVRVWPW